MSRPGPEIEQLAQQQLAADERRITGARRTSLYLVHSDCRPRSRAYRAVWRNHRLHHHKNEHYWFTVTTAGTADRILGTYPEPGSVETSPTVRALHSSEHA